MKRYVVKVYILYENKWSEQDSYATLAPNADIAKEKVTNFVCMQDAEIQPNEVLCEIDASDDDLDQVRKLTFAAAVANDYPFSCWEKAKNAALLWAEKNLNNYDFSEVP